MDESSLSTIGRLRVRRSKAAKQPRGRKLSEKDRKAALERDGRAQWKKIACAAGDAKSGWHYMSREVEVTR